MSSITSVLRHRQAHSQDYGYSRPLVQVREVGKHVLDMTAVLLARRQTTTHLGATACLLALAVKAQTRPANTTTKRKMANRLSSLALALAASRSTTCLV